MDKFNPINLLFWGIGELIVYAAKKQIKK